MAIQMNDPIAISLVAHTEYCLRRAWLEMNGEKTDTFQMQAGYSAHATVDQKRSHKRVARHHFKVWSSELNLVGICDSVETLPDGSLRVIEYKATPVRKEAVVTESNRLQLALQGLCLRQMGYEVSEYAVYFTDHRKTIAVELSDVDFSHALEQVERTKALAQGMEAPAPLIEDRKCNWCSHISLCLPDENQGRQTVRRILASNPDSQTVHLTVQGSRASLCKGRLVVTKGDERLGSVPLERVEALVVHGNIDVSSALIRNLAWNRQTVVWCSSSGRLYGWMLPADGPNGLARVRQHVLAETGYLPIASEIVSTKIYNQATMLRRHSIDDVAVSRLRNLQSKPKSAHNLSDLFGIEGEAASIYFEYFGEMLNEDALAGLGAQWCGRIGRGAQDPINVLLNYAYGILTSECVRALVACGLDPHAGFLHSSSRNKPACALDLMEEFRPAVADSVVLTLINRREISSSDFFTLEGVASLKPSGRRAVVKAFERRIQTQFKHPTFGYTVSWRRAIEIQARMILGVVDGTQKRYKGIRIR